MLRRFSVNFAIFSMGLDIGLTYLAFAVAVWLRPFLTGLTFPISIPHYDIDIPGWFYAIMPILWLTIFLLNSVYAPFLDSFLFCPKLFYTRGYNLVSLKNLIRSFPFSQ